MIFDCPTGGVLVLEVKGGELRKLSANGRWEGTDSDHPLTQLLAEWQAILAATPGDSGGPMRCRLVAEALCTGRSHRRFQDRLTKKETDRNLIVDRSCLPLLKRPGVGVARRDHLMNDADNLA